MDADGETWCLAFMTILMVVMYKVDTYIKIYIIFFEQLFLPNQCLTSE
jgi:hypothetical protein